MEKSLSLAAAVAVVAVSLLLLASLLLSLVSRPKADKAATAAAATTEEVVVDHLVGHGGTTSIGHGNALGAFESRGCKMIVSSSSRCSILSTILRLKVK